MTQHSSDMVELKLELAAQGIRTAMVASCECGHPASISPEPNAHYEICRYRVLYVAADALADAQAAIESHRAELAGELAEVTGVAKSCAKREAQYFADRKNLHVALKRCRISLNLVTDERFNPAGHKRIKEVTDIIDEALAAIAGAARQSGDVQQAPGEAPQSGHEVASPKGGSHA